MMLPLLETEEERTAFPTIGRFTLAHALSGQQPAKIDVIRFFSNRQAEFEKDIHSLADRSTTPSRDGTAELFIIEAIDPLVAQYFLRNRVGVHRVSFLQFLEDFLDSYPSYNFDDMQNHFQPRPSTTARQRHVCFQVMSIREFDHAPGLDRDGLYKAVEKRAETWKDVRLHGILEPAQRKEGGTPTAFPPCVLSRNHFAAWVDGDTGKGWQTGLGLALVVQMHCLELIVASGVILVDRLLNLDGFGGGLKPPSYGKLARENVLLGLPDAKSYRTALSFYMEHNQDIVSGGLPSPFTALQDMYRIISSEWTVLNTYIVRDLNDIGWTLLGANSGLRSKGQFDETLDVLFSTQWRLGWILQLAEKPLQSCRERGHVNWQAISLVHGGPYNEASLSTALVEDFEKVLSQLSLSRTRVEQSISHVMALTAVVHTKLGLQETGQAVAQNKVLMVLSLVAILFLPANYVAALFSMQGDWAPGQPNFGLYWAVVVSLSTLLLILLMAVWFWTSITSVSWFQAPGDTEGRPLQAQRQRQWYKDLP